MSSWLDRLERRFRGLAPQNLTLYLVGLQAVCWVLEQMRPGFTDVLTLDAAAVARGQVWRVLTFLVLPPSPQPLLLFFSLWWTYSIGTAIEQAWGPARYALYWLLGMAATAACAVLFGVPGTNQYLLLSLLLAYATMNPELQITFFFVIPMRMKWLAWLEVGLLGLRTWMLPGATKLLPVIALGNYLVFFAPTLLQAWRARTRQAVHVVAMDRAARSSPAAQKRVCATCGVTDDDRRVEFRVCTCDRCGKPTNFCLPHVREHLGMPAPDA